MAKCTICGKFISAKGGTAACCKCGNKYHPTCIGLSETARVGKGWQCSGCKETASKTCMRPTPAKLEAMDVSEGTPSSVKDSYEYAGDTASGYKQAQDISSSGPEDLRNEISMLRSDLREMRDDLKAELREFRLEITDLRKSAALYKKKVDSLESRLKQLEERPPAVIPDPVVSKLENTVDQLKIELNEREQDLLLSDIEISNLPEDAGENVLHTVELVAKKLGVDLEPRDIVFAERVGLRAQASPSVRAADLAAAVAQGRRIVVRLARRAVRDQLLQGSRTRRGATSADLGLSAPPRRFYVNERLTRTNKHLFFRARQAAARLGWRFTWTRGGRILTKEGDGKRTHSIRSYADLERVFGLEALAEEST